MKKFVLLTFTVSTLFVISCTKEDTRPDCEKNNWGTLNVDNYLKSPYKVYIDGAYKGTVDAYGNVDYTSISSGTHATKYIQASGYVLYPTEYTLSVNITSCNTYSANLK